MSIPINVAVFSLPITHDSQNFVELLTDMYYNNSDNKGFLPHNKHYEVLFIDTDTDCPAVAPVPHS